ncbi:hypothetical protein Q4Q34_14330 [Flavivirga abyssicola]|nr:hypothetical protein [Flavivirga sp. MEBiC07777]WVK12400.1 hypothetical protein Q4Q34_14330 [Flavivirga sp. MEBiC07777]
MKNLKSILKKWKFGKRFLHLKNSENYISVRLNLINRDTNDIHMFI